MKLIPVSALLVIVLTGCADNPAKDAAIEDRGVKAAAVTPKPEIKPATQIVEANKPTDAKAEAARSAASKPAESPETRAVTQPIIESKPIEAAKLASEAKANEAAKNKLLLDPKDPLSPLAQRRVLFDYDSAAIRDEFRSMLEAHAEYLKANARVKITLQGHTDERGSPEYNIALGQRRAESVYKALNLLGVMEDQMEAVSFGEVKPLSEAHDEAGWSQNRRTEIAYPNE